MSEDIKDLGGVSRIELSKINIDLDRALREAAHDGTVAPDGFHAKKLENMQRFVGTWPKTFPPIEPNTPIYWLVDMLTTMITEHELEPLQRGVKDLVEDVVAKELHSPEIKKQMDYYIETTVRNKIKEYFIKHDLEANTMANSFVDELKDL